MKMRRKTRFVCISDTHAYTPSEAGFKLPAGDVLIHAGDLTNHGSAAELRKTMSWIATADFEVKIIICGSSSPAQTAKCWASKYGLCCPRRPLVGLKKTGKLDGQRICTEYR